MNQLINSQSIEMLPADRADTLMRAAVITGPGNIELQTAPIPEPAADEVRIRMEGCGLCASNLTSWEGRDWFSYPMEAGSPGHEGWGIVDAVGKHVHTVKPGYRVTALSHHAYAEYDIAKEDHVVELPADLKGKPFPGEPLGCAFNILRRSRIESGMTVAVVGTGFLGSLLVRLAKQAGAKVIALSRRSSSRAMAAEYGADEVLPVEDHKKVVEQVENLTKNKLCERVIETTGKQQPLDLAGKLTGVRGRLIIAGYHQDGRRHVDMQLWNWRGIDVINAHERDPMEYVWGIRQAVKAVENRILDPFSLFTHTFPQEHIQQAFEMHRQKPEGFIKALITFT